MTDEADPMDGADVGETRTVIETQDLHTVDFEPDVFWGTDRYADRDITNVEIIQHDDGLETIRLTWEGEVTKTLPYRWDDPIRAQNPPEIERGLTGWKQHAATAVRLLVPFGVTIAIAGYVMGEVSTSITSINGEPVRTPTPAEYLPTIALIAGLALVIGWGLRGGFPGMAGGRR